MFIWLWNSWEGSEGMLASLVSVFVAGDGTQNINYCKVGKVPYHWAIALAQFFIFKLKDIEMNVFWLWSTRWGYLARMHRPSMFRRDRNKLSSVIDWLALSGAAYIQGVSHYQIEFSSFSLALSLNLIYSLISIKEKEKRNEFISWTRQARNGSYVCNLSTQEAWEINGKSEASLG